ncbi:MAG: hypothetical protein ACI9OO_002106, partial [Bacteroidia bacterium]
MEYQAYQEYVTAWGFYLGACVVLISIGCYWTRGIRNDYLRGIMRLVASVAMLLPVIHEDNGEMLVPALVVVFLGAFIGNTIAAVKATNILAFAVIGAVVVAIILVGIGRQWRAAPVKSAANADSELSEK